MEDLIRQGKILYWGVSEWPAWMMVKATYIARELGARPPVVNEPRYNLLYRYPEWETFPVTRGEGIGNVIFSPLAHGILTGKYKPKQPAPEGTRAADPDQNMVIRRMYWKEEYKEKAQALVEIAEGLGTFAASLSIAWAARHPAVTSVILGTRTVAQLEENLAALDVDLPAEVVERLEALFPLPETIPQA
jgi:aryl-alcohol dehydrogenase-like predicted oxidoreductase